MPVRILAKRGLVLLLLRSLGLTLVLMLLSNFALRAWGAWEIQRQISFAGPGPGLEPATVVGALLLWDGERRARTALREPITPVLSYVGYWLSPRTTLNAERFAVASQIVGCSSEADCALKFDEIEPERRRALSRLLDSIQASHSFRLRRYINGLIQLATFTLFLLGLDLVRFRGRSARRDRKRLEAAQGLFEEILSENPLKIPRGGLARAVVEERLDGIEDSKGDVFREAIIDVLHSFAQTGALSEARTALAEALARLQLHFESVGVWVRYLTWVIPSIGFIGTILGIGNALGSAHQVVQDPARQEQAIQSVTGELAVAFDTTLVALLCSVVLMFSRSAVEAQEDSAIRAFENGCRRYILKKVRVESVTRELSMFLERVTQETIAMAEQTWTEVSKEREKRIVEALQKLVLAMGGKA